MTVQNRRQSAAMLTPSNTSGPLDDLTGNTEPWMADRGCVDVNPELFFPHPGENPAEAKAICRACPVRTDCLAYALRLEAEPGMFRREGIWGGTTPTERRRLTNGHRDPLQPSRDAVVRQWAHQHGHPCPPRGRIPAALGHAYDLAHQLDTTTTEQP